MQENDIIFATASRTFPLICTASDGGHLVVTFIDPSTGESRVLKCSEFTVENVVDQAGKSILGPYVNTGPEHMPLGLADRKAHDARLAECGERDES